MVPGSRAEEVLNGYAATAENYPKAVKQLQERFGNPHLLVQVYVRELIGLVIRNVENGRVCPDLASLYDKLESQLRSLESLGRTKEQFSEFLSPLVESCLPDDVLRLWKRTYHAQESESSGGTLGNLMNFLKQEVEGEAAVQLAQSSFGFKAASPNPTTPRGRHTNRDQTQMETAASLVASPKEQYNKFKRQEAGCIFCSKFHKSSSCYEIRDKPLEERKRIALEKGACFICLRIGHSARLCTMTSKCLICGRRHAMILCPDMPPAKSNTGIVDDKPEDSTALCNRSRNQVLLGTFLTKLENGSKDSVVRCLLDTGSQRSYISESLAKELDLPVIREEVLIHGLFGGTETHPQRHSVHKVYLCSRDNSYRCNFDTLTQPTICGKVGVLSEQEIEAIKKEYKISTTEEHGGPLEVQLLIGADVAGRLLTGDVKSVGPQLSAVGTRLGWVIMGKRSLTVSPDNTQSTVCTFSNVITNLWRMELLGIMDPLQSLTKEAHQQEIMEQFMDGIKVGEKGRYQVSLPWKTSHPPLPDNKAMTLSRLQSTKRRLAAKGLLEDYQKVFEEWRQEGIIEPVSSTDVTSWCHYLPHRPVIKEGSTTRIRPVFDASARQKGHPSLNDCLETGTNLMEEIPNILDRFRDKNIGVVADIEKAFLQLEVEASQRDYLRFVGVDDKEYRHKRVVFGVSSSPFLLNAVIKLHLEKMSAKYERTVRKLKDAFYVDNCVYSVENVQELHEFVTESTAALKEGCFNLRGWESNYLGSPTPNEATREVGVLGMIWNLGRDTLSCNAPEISQDVISKRTILSGTQRIFDPIGFLCPFMLSPKILLQELWSTKISWDSIVPEEVKNKFIKWKNQVPLLELVELPRRTQRGANSQLHVFTDASQRAYAACVFVRINSEDCGSELRLLRAKARVAPCEKMTIPRLELMACLIGARLANSIREALRDNSIPTTYWSDSLNALWWIAKGGNWTTFVSNRTKEIRTLSRPEQWRFVPGERNPADLLSRGCSAAQLLQERWWEGPSWLRLTEDNWPDRVALTCADITSMAALETEPVNQKSAEEEEPNYLEYFSSYHKILRMVAWMRRFGNNARKGKAKHVGILSADEIAAAERTLLRNVQRKSLTVHRRASLAKVYQDEERLWRLETRITEREDSPNFLYPIVLTGSHPLIFRLIEEEHRKACHAGPQILFGVLRERFWILGVKKTLRKVINNCMRCKRFMQKPMNVEPAALPKDRVKDSVAFEVTGIDLTGPLFVKEGKVWIVLFTCGNYRAIHLELISSLSTPDFLQALRRFIARRGRPSVIYTDNGSNFCGAENRLRALDWTTITQGSDTVRIKWKFNPPTAAWWGGWWERLVRVVKELLRRTLGRAHLKFEELLTILCECEAVINSRPLTYCSGDADEMIPITPMLFLRDLKRGGVEDIDMVEAGHLERRVRYRVKLLKDLRQRFRKEYLGALIEKGKGNKGTSECKVGEVVHVGDEQTKRMSWPLGLITTLHPGRDGRVRCVSVKTSKGVMVRPVQRLYSLEFGGEPGSLQDLPPPYLQSTLEENEEEDSRDEPPGVEERTTRRGRLVRQPTRLDLFNQAIYLFDSNIK